MWYPSEGRTGAVVRGQEEAMARPAVSSSGCHPMLKGQEELVHNQGFRDDWGSYRDPGGEETLQAENTAQHLWPFVGHCHENT